MLQTNGWWAVSEEPNSIEQWTGSGKRKDGGKEECNNKMDVITNRLTNNTDLLV